MSNAMCDVTSHVAHTVSASDCDLGCERYQKGKRRKRKRNESSRLCGVFTSRTSEYTHEIKETELEFASSSSSSCLFVFCLSIILFLLLFHLLCFIFYLQCQVIILGSSVSLSLKRALQLPQHLKFTYFYHLSIYFCNYILRCK